MRNPLSSQPRSLPRRSRATRARRVSLECLEDRQLLAGFSFADFSNPGGLSLIGDASTTNSRLRLTPAIGGQEGGAWYTAEKQFVGTAFETTFQFQLTENFDAPGGSDGLVFLIQNHAPTYLAGGGGTLGYDGLRNSLAVEFDTFQNSEVNDPSPSHISVHTNGTGPNGWSESLSLGSYSTSPALMDDGAIHTVKIAYTPGTLSVYLDNLTTPKLAVAVDLAETLGLDAGRSWVGFTATTGGGWQNHDVLNWTYTVLPDVSTTVVVNDPSVVEGNAGTSNLVFTVTRAGDISGTTTVNWATEDRTAAAGSDYTAASGQVVFAPGVAQQTVTVSVNGDTTVEPDETLALRLSSATGGSIADGVGIGTILSDDVTVAVNDAQVIEGDSRFGSLGALVSMAGNGGLLRSSGMAFGPDGNLYVGSLDSDEVMRYDATTGAFLGAFITAGSGGLNGPAVDGLSFRPDGRLYVASRDGNSVLRYDAASGAYLDTFVTAGSGGLLSPKGMAFAPDGSLLVSSGTNEVLRYSGTSGAFLGAFVAAGSGGLSNPRSLTFGPDGNLYVSSSASHSVLKYNGTTGAFISTFISTNSGGLGNPGDLLFAGGHLYVASQNPSQILRYDAATGAFVDAAVPPSSGGLDRPIGLLQDANNHLLVGSYAEVLRYGPASQAAFTISLSSAVAAPVTLSYSTANGSAIAGGDYNPVSGTLTFDPGETTKTVLVPTLDDAVGEPTETFVLNLSNPIGVTITDGQGVATILDNETKFFVVDDATSNSTFEYGSGGASVENYALNGGNTAPRGAASTAAGDRVWVVDANKKVYVYDTSGGLLGSWTAGSLASNATVEGIATNGTDVWIVDARQDRVYRYTGAATRLSGSQNAASNFSLNSGNTNPKDIVTDGANLWVVNDTTTDKVFKYNISGSLVGSWTITGAGSSPTGITLDPSGGGHLWIVDSGTDRVYQFDGATARGSGSLSPSTSFALAAGNANPQGIADPPVAGSSSPAAGREAASPPRQVAKAVGRRDLIDVALHELGRPRRSAAGRVTWVASPRAPGDGEPPLQPTLASLQARRRAWIASRG